MDIFDMLQLVVDKDGSDLHLVMGAFPSIRVDGQLLAIDNTPVLTALQTQTLITPLLSTEQIEYVKLHKELDFGYQFKNHGRFRVNVYHTKGSLAAALRLIPSKIRTIADLQLPEVFMRFSGFKQGFVLVTGPTGEGKSTTLAAVIEQINISRSEHILTIEDPIEYVFQSKKSLISQREMNQDTQDWSIALRSALREDPDVVLVGEMRDYETIAAAITVAETGHLVFATLHTASAAQTVDRIIDVFPAHQQSQIRQQLAGSIKGVVSQRLVPMTNKGRVAATEVMIANPAIRNLIREAKTHQIDNVIQTSAGEGMMLIESSLAQLVRQGMITKDMGREFAFRPDEYDRLMGDG